MANTTNFNWETPDDTDLVKDGAAAIRTLGSAIDTSLVDLKGGTTGQVLSKATNTDMDFTWVAQDDSNAIQNALLTTTGDTIYASGASTPARLGIGSTGQVLTVSGGVPTWASPAGGGKVLQVVQATYSTITSITTSTQTDSGLTASITPSSASSKVLVLVAQPTLITRSENQVYYGQFLYRNSTEVYGTTNQGLNMRATGATLVERSSIVSMHYLDSPATTSSITYKTTGQRQSGSGTLEFQPNSSTSTMILLEIGA